MTTFKRLLKEIIKNVLEEDLRIDKHPQADLIKKAVGDENHLISFSDINKVGINPETSFNTPAGIYGWHFTQRTLRGAKKNKIFASERKYGHLLKIKNPDKVLWLGTDQTGTSAKSPAEAMKAFAKVYPILNEPKIQFDDEGVVNPQYDGDGGKKISAAEWLRDSEVVAGYRTTSSRQTGGESKSEKLYDLIMATSAVLELDMIAGKKKTVAANALLRSLGIDAVVDKDCKGVIHNAETCQGFFTHKGGLEHVATIENRLYNLNKTAVSRILQSPTAPEDKLWDAINALTKDFALDLGNDDPEFGDEISTDDALDILRISVGGENMYEDGNKNITSDMLLHIFKFALPRRENSPILAGALIEEILEHPSAPPELLKSYMETAIEERNSNILAAIAANPEMTPEELKTIAEAGTASDHKVQVSLARNPNTPPEVLDKLAEMFYADASVAGSVSALKHPNTPIETVNKWAGYYARFRAMNTKNPARPLAALSNPNVDDSIVAGLIFDENAEIKDDFSTLIDVSKLENLPPEFMEEIVNWLAKGNYSQSSGDVSSITDAFTALLSNKTVTSNQLLKLLTSYPEVLPVGNDDWEYLLGHAMWIVLQHENLSREVLELANDLWVKDSVKLVNNGILSRNRFDAINNVFSEKFEKVGNQKESIQNTLKQMIKEELLAEAKFEREATQISREIMKRITAHLDAYDGEPRVPHRYKANKNDLDGFGYGGYSQPKVPETLKAEGVNAIVVKLGVEPSTAFAKDSKFASTGQARMGDDEGGRQRMIVIDVALSDAFTRDDLSLLNARVKSTITHELTHGGQGEDILAISGNAQKEAFRLGMKTIEGIRSYYLDPAEVEAFARGMYKQAKMTKTPFHEMVSTEIDRNLAYYTHPKELERVEFSEQEVRSFFDDDYRQALLDYARKNLPAAVLENQDFISSLRKMIKEELLGEGRLEAETTEMTRAAMPTIVKYAKEGFVGDDSDEDVMFVDNPDTVEFQKEKGNYNWHILPASIMMKVQSVRFEFGKIDEVSSGKNFTISGGYQAYKEFEDEDRSKAIIWNGSMVFIHSFFTPEFSEQDLNDYLANLKATLIHELEHSIQPEDVLMTSDPAQIDGLDQRDHDFSKISGLANYFLSQAELEAFAKGMYKEAKFKKISYSVVARDLADRYNTLFLSKLEKMPEDLTPPYTSEELSQFFDRFYAELMTVGQAKYPSILRQQKENIQNTLREMIKEEVEEWKPTGEEMMFPAIYLTSHMGEYDKEPHWKEWRKKSDEEKFAWAEKMDFSEPVEITVFADGTFAHGDGHHRVMAGKVLDIEIPIIITRNKLKEYEAGVWEKWLNAALHKSPKQLNPEGYNLKTMETLDYILGSREQKENKQHILRRMIKEELSLDADKRETEIHLAENGDCGVFAVALLRELLDAGVNDAEMMIIGDPATYEGQGDTPSFEDFYNIDIFHIAVFHNGQYYDVNGRTTPDGMLNRFVPYGGGGITPDDYSPTFGRDFLSESFVVSSRDELDNTIKGFVLATTNVQTSVENYSERARQIAEETTIPLSREQKENKQMNLTSTLREMVEEEINHSKPLRQLNEISSEVYDGVVNAAANLSDSQMSPLFGNQERVLIPMKAEGNEQVQAFYDNIVTPLATKGIKVNLEDGTATKEVTTQRGKQERKTRLGKAIGKELPDTAKAWWNKFQAEFLGNPDILKAKYGIIITQHPVDVARMSDFSEADIESCHSEGSDYFTCALADAKRSGAVAYLIKGEDVPYAEENLDDNELFADDNRGVEGITPISRVRLRRFDNPDLAEQGSALALLAPETRIYGERIPGFLNTVADWAREVQKGHPVFKKKLDLRDFTLRGGSYQDTQSSEMFNILVGPENLELNPELEAYGYSDQTRKESGEEQIDYVEDGRNQEMIDYAIDQIESFRYDILDHESVNFDYNVTWDDWNESVEISYEIEIEFDYPVDNFIGAPNVGSIGGPNGYERDEVLYALGTDATLNSVRLVAETTYEDSEEYNANIDLNYSVKIVNRRFGADTRKIVQVKMFVNDSVYDAESFESDVAREIETITDSWNEIYAGIEEALREEGWMIETSYDKLKVDSEHPGKLGEDSFDLFNISKGPNGIAARMMIPMKGYPDAGMRKSDGVDVLYKEGPKFVEIMRSDSPLWDVKGGFAVLPPSRRHNVLSALKKEIKDAAKAAAMQPSLPMGDLPAGEDKDMRPILPAIEEVQVFMKQVRKDEASPYRKKGSADYKAQGGIMFTFKPGSSDEQIQANLKFIKYFDKNPAPVQDALQKEWNNIADDFAAAQPLVEPEAKKEKEPEEEASHLAAYKESISSLLRNLIKEEMSDADYAGVDPIDYKGQHSAPMADDGSPLWDVSAEGHYPKDVYGPNGLSWNGTGSALDEKAYDIIKKAKGLPGKPLDIYRAVPKGVKGINRGDWVTTVFDYAKQHGDSALNGDYDIVQLKVTARDIYTNGDSWMEWGYDPQPRIPYSEREDWERYPGRKK